MTRGLNEPSRPRSRLPRWRRPRARPTSIAGSTAPTGRLQRPTAARGRDPDVNAGSAGPARGHAPDAPPAEAAIRRRPRPEVVVSTRPATVDEIFELSGMRPQLPSIAARIRAEYCRARARLGERDRVLFAQIVRPASAPARQFAPARAPHVRSNTSRRLPAPRDTTASSTRSPSGFRSRSAGRIHRARDRPPRTRTRRRGSPPSRPGSRRRRPRRPASTSCSGSTG